MTHQTNEYWYMGSILARSEIQKNSTELCCDTGTYRSLALSISASVMAAAACLASISMESTLEEDRIRFADSSSRMLPADDST